ncbi:phosphatase PAP2 family protein [Candidatus Aminicenantes bacterium AC-708-M15]|jgi:hypothetical protein|nr:phosphatase PAP2 family protein [SCandidatus Aminicenantes bacterium Aminicenantia_JdfR_composite]MCP2604042.1 phosphatase PAP2 family protein [Candidatus Aminicenantes bacterium AC-708-M15]MCP2618327.1 phosphatase PAP2 family protein [Candidatus Aminicenantes bacterium AC-335-A11]
MKKTLFLFLFIWFSLTTPFQSIAEEYKLNKDFIPNLFRDSAEVFTSPKKWGKEDLMKFGAVTGITLFLYISDEKIQNWFISNRTNTTDEISKFVRNFGNGYYLTGILGGIYVMGEILDEKSLRRTALLGLESFIISGTIVSGIKILVGRMRPSATNNANVFSPFRFSSKYHSFPSGHSATAFAVATAISEQSKNVLIDITAYSIACLVALSRVNDNYHWASDVFFGSALGYFIGKKISSIDLKRESLNAFFNMGNNKFYFTVKYSF